MNRVLSLSSALRCAFLAFALLVFAQEFQASAQTMPRVLSAKLEGKKLIVSGENFAVGAMILIDGRAEKTKNNAGDPTGMLIAKKGGKRIDANQVVTLRVVNSDGVASSGFRFFGGPTITLADHGKTMEFQVGQQFLVALGGGYGWTVHLDDFSNVVPVPTLLPILGSQGIYEAVAPGKASLIVSGEPNCKKGEPPCPEAPFTFEVTILIRPN